MDKLLYLIARAAVGCIQALPLRAVARLGRAGGGLAYWLDARHRRVALQNLTRAFGLEKSSAELRAIARENFRRIGENFSCAVKTASMTREELQPHVRFMGDATILSTNADPPPPKVVVAIGHFGNFELYARFAQFALGRSLATTYRGLRQPSLDRLLQSLRKRSGCHYFERRFDSQALKAFMQRPGAMLGLLADQHAGKNGLRVPFLGHECSTSAAPALFALRYDCGLHTGICYRVGLAQWEIEAGPPIATHQQGKARPTEDIMLDVNRAFEKAVRRDPANWFWVHKRWKPQRSRGGDAISAESPEPAPNATSASSVENPS